MTGRSRPADRPRSPDLGASVAAQVAALKALDREALLALWVATLEGEPPARLSQPLLRRMLAWELQAQALGGLSAATARKLERLAAEQGRTGRGGTGDAKVPTARAANTRLKPGGRLLREWGGVTHVVDVVEGGFLWRGQRHRSLSAIARAITGAHWSGPRFFGLSESPGGAPAKATRRASVKPSSSAPRPARASRSAA